MTVGGTVRCWGENSRAALGDNTLIPFAPAPVEVCETGAWAVSANGCLDGESVSTMTDTASVATGGGHVCALSTAGGVKCWGHNGLGQLGDARVCGATCGTPVQVTGLESGVVAISAGWFHTCALVEVDPPATGFGAVCWGYNHMGQLGEAHVCSTHLCAVPVQPTGMESGVAQISAGALHTCAVLLDGGAVKCWGLNFDGQLGDGTAAMLRTTPVNVCPTAGATGPCAVPLQGASSVTARGAGHSCAIMAADGSVKCWGSNGSGELGDGTTTTTNTPTDVCAAGAQAPCGASLLTGAASISGGFFHTCALMSDEGALCWGANDDGQLGDGLLAASSTPGAVCASGSGSGCPALGGITQLSAGFKHGCALMPAGAVRCWGANTRGELGDNSTVRQPVAVPVTLDTDRDGCTDEAEEQTAAASQYTGGLRDPLDHWDVLDVWTAESDPSTPETLTRDHVVTIHDVIGVASRFGPDDGSDGIDEFSDPLSPPPPAPAYHPAFDRGPVIGANNWDRAPADGAINVPDDILGTATQFGHNCGVPATPPEPAPTPVPGAVTVDVGEYWFCDPSYQSGVCETTVDVGGTVVWDFDQALAPHTATDCGADCDAPTATPLWDSGLLTSGTFAQTFDSPGSFLYYCSVHPDTMRGRIVVNAP